jgi:hypothetical protein
MNKGMLALGGALLALAVSVTAQVPGGGPGGPGGGPGGGGRRFDPSRMKDVNFLSTKADPNNPRGSRRVEGNKRMIAMLEAKARGGSATAKR